MITQYHSPLDETVYEEQLSSGLMIRIIPKVGFSRKYAFFATGYGSVHTKFSMGGRDFVTPDGVAHYLEHKTFDTREGNALQLFAERGANPNAFTSYNMTAYYFDCTQQFEDNLELLLHFVSTPHYTQESVEKERGIIAQEIRMYEDNAESRVYENLFAAMYAHHPIRVPIAGTVESIEEITAQTLQDCHHAFYDPSNMMLCVVGDVEPTSVIAIAKRICGTSAGTVTKADLGGEEAPTPVTPRVETHMDIAMPTFALGFKCRPCEGAKAMEQEFIGELASEILIGESSYLYQKLYEDGLIDSDFSCAYDSVEGAAMLTMSGDSRDPDAVCRAVIEEAQRLIASGVDEALFERLKKSLFGRRVRDLDSFESICFRQCTYYFEGCNYFDFPKIYGNITLDTIVSFLRSAIVPEQMAISIIYPREAQST